MSSWGPVFLASRRAPSSRLTWVAKSSRSSRLRGESWAGLSPRRREAREENAKDFSLVAALLLCVHPCSSVVSFRFFSCGSVGRATTPYLADIHQQAAELTGFHSLLCRSEGVHGLQSLLLPC